MESIVFRAFGVLFQAVGLLILAGLMVTVLTDLQHRALVSKRSGLTSMLKINEQLVGPIGKMSSELNFEKLRQLDVFGAKGFNHFP